VTVIRICQFYELFLRKSGKDYFTYNFKLEIKMTYPLIKLTLPIVIKKIEYVLDEYPEYPYQLAFSIYKLRQQLIVHILSLIPSHYAVEGDPGIISNLKGRYFSPLEEQLQLQLEMVVHGSILHILSENSDWLSRNMPPAHPENKTATFKGYEEQIY
jgi:hypothetical protein